MWGGEGGESTGFRFNFGGGGGGGGCDDDDEGGVAPATDTDTTANAVQQVIPGSEYVPSPDDAAPDWDMEEVIIRGRRFIKGASSGAAALLVRDASAADGDDDDGDGNGNEKGKSFASSDVVKGKYEGGFKLWECSVDLAAYLLEHDVLKEATTTTTTTTVDEEEERKKNGAGATTTTKASNASRGGGDGGGDDNGDGTRPAAGDRKRRRRQASDETDDDAGERDASTTASTPSTAAAAAAAAAAAPLMDKCVIELGCGHGLPGIAAAYRGAASVVFADYNPEVLETLTAPNVLANTPDIIAAAAANAAAATKAIAATTKTGKRNGGRSNVNMKTSKAMKATAEEETSRAPSFRYLGGDWANLHDFIEPRSADVVLAAETIYSPAAYPKHVAILRHCMKPPHGVALVAAKSYYFGVGGGTRLFAAAAEKDGSFEVDTVASYSDGASNVREILRVRFKKQ